MAEFNATPLKKPDLPIVPCVKCGDKGHLHNVPIWDDPGDCAPTIDDYEYMVSCHKCHMETAVYASPEIAIKVWNAFMGK